MQSPDLVWQPRGGGPINPAAGPEHRGQRPCHHLSHLVSFFVLYSTAKHERGLCQGRRRPSAELNRRPQSRICPPGFSLVIGRVGRLGEADSVIPTHTLSQSSPLRHVMGGKTEAQIL